MPMSEETLRTLRVNKELNDNVINGFAYIMCEYAFVHRKKLVIPVDVLLTPYILNKNPLPKREQNWLSQLNVSNADVVQLPYNRGKYHWALFTLYRRHKLICYFDSLLLSPEPEWFSRVLTFAQMFLNVGEIVSDWKYYTAKDIPQQSTSGNRTLDCGVHVCAWLYSSCMQNNIVFTAADMNKARRCIATLLYNYKSESDFHQNFQKSKENRKLRDMEKEVSHEGVRSVDINLLGYASTFEMIQKL